jgi:hypothetical protein
MSGSCARQPSGHACTTSLLASVNSNDNWWRWCLPVGAPPMSMRMRG